ERRQRPRDYTFLTNSPGQPWLHVAGLCHSEFVVPELAGREGETPEQRAAGAEAIIASRVPDIRVLLDYVLTESAARPCARRHRGPQLRRLDCARLSRRAASNSGGCGARAMWKFESEARDSAGEAGVQVGPRSADARSGGGPRRLPSARRHVRDLRQNTLLETHGRSSPRRPHAFHG